MSKRIFSHRDPLQPDFWSERFEHAYTPWESIGIPNALKQYVQRTQPVTTLIPGCGHGDEIAYLSEAGWEVTGFDFSVVAVRRAQQYLGKWGQRVFQADFFTYVPAEQVGWIYERAFLCALPPEQWPAVSARWGALLPPGGVLAGFFFLADTLTGPPFGISRKKLSFLLESNFELMNEQPVDDSNAIFSGKEVWLEWRRRGVSY